MLKEGSVAVFAEQLAQRLRSGAAQPAPGAASRAVPV
jgi:hypothetical protein